MNRPNQPSGPALVLRVGIFAAFAGVLWLAAAPNFIRSGSTKINAIINNLRQLDGAKEAWAFEHHQTGAVKITRAELGDYLRLPRRKGWVQSVAGERYILNRLSEPPEAELTRTVDGRPKGTRIRLLPEGVRFSVSPLGVTNWGCEIVLPGNGAPPSTAAPHQ